MPDPNCIASIPAFPDLIEYYLSAVDTLICGGGNEIPSHWVIYDLWIWSQ